MDIIREFVEAILKEYIEEPKRKTGKSADELGVRPDNGKENIKSVYNDATEAEKDYWGKWYHHAKSDVQELAAKYNMPFEQMAAIVATLSPGNKWHGNLGAAERLMDGAVKINAYPVQLKKAIHIKNTGELNVTGPKVSVFYKSLLDPTTLENELVLDSHAINIWLGKKVPLKQTPTISKTLREKIVADYHEAAKELGVPTQSVQSLTWYIWKYMPSHIAPAPLVSNPEVANDNDVEQDKKKTAPKKTSVKKIKEPVTKTA